MTCGAPIEGATIIRCKGAQKGMMGMVRFDQRATDLESRSSALGIMDHTDSD
ncbi:hypothetical protein BJY01DRAFT_217515 [Aspergillus pseudoustus]|uniref:Uncharacterized protein n=1 Tax=Aspergillus pseudoustus TaxID=1810923 RepID=A0ABR4JQU9_9EURO